MNKMGESSSLLEFIDLDELQAIQDSFAKTVGISSVIFSPEGEPLTRFSYPTGFCSLIQSTEEGKRRCFQSFKEMSRKAIKLKKPAILYCFAHGGHFVAPIIINDEHKGTMFAGQFIPQSFSPKQLKALEKTAVEINLEPQLLTKEAKEMCVIEEDVVEFYSSLLFQIVKFIGRLGAKAAELNRAQEALQKARDALETRVQERTAELVKSNKQLKREITERKRAEEALLQSEIKYRTLVEHIPAITYIAALDESSTTLYVSPQIETILGISPADYKADPDFWVKHLHPDDRERVMDEIRRCHESDQPFILEYRMVSKDGRLVWLSDDAVIVKDDKGKPLHLHGVMYDITERKRIEEALRESKTLAENLIASLKDGFSVLDSQGVHLNVNLALCQMTGFKREELIGTGPPHPYWPEEEYENIENAFQKTLRGEFEDFELIFKRKNGERFPVIVSPSRIMDEKANGISYFATVKDITERKQAEEELRLFSQAVDSSPDGVAMGNFEGRITYVNETFVRMFGYSKEELIGKEIAFIYSKDQIPKLEEALKATMEGGWTGELVGKRKNGELFPMAISSTVVMDEEGRVIAHMASHRDITERKRAEEELKQKTEQQEVLLSSIPAFVYCKDIESNLIAANKAFAEMVNVPIDQLAGKDAYDLFPKEQAKKFHIDDKKVMSSGRPIMNIEEKFTDAEGKTRWASTSKVPSFDEKGKVTGMVGITFDITERKQAEEELRSSEERLKILFEFAPDAYYLNDLKGTFVDSNKAAEEITGYKRSELIGKSFLKLKLLPPKQIPKAAKLLAQNALGKPTGPDEFTLICKDGSPIAVGISTFPIKIKGQTLVLGIARDITERKRADEALRESEEKFRLLSEQNLLGIIILQDGFVKYANQAACEITEYSSEEALNWGANGFTMLLHPDDLEFVMEQAKKKQQGAKDVVTHYSYRIVTKSGKVIWVDQYSKTISFEGRNADLITLTDITERKRVEEERKQLRKELEAKNTEMERFTYTVSHDLRSPLVTVQGFAKMLREDFGRNEKEKVESDLKYIESSATKMDRLLTDTLQLSRIGRFVNPPEDVPFGKIVQEALEQTAQQIKSSGVEITVAEDFPAVHVDRMRIAEVLVNLVINSINYMGEQASPKIDIGYRADDSETVFFVRDNGIGIDKSQHEKVFELFYTVDKSGKGTGAGLAIVKRIIEVHEGRIWIESEKGKGCTVCFTLPIV